jgi:hypothetical protein
VFIKWSLPMGGPSRHLARGILFLGALVALVPFLHLGAGTDDPVSAKVIHRSPPAMVAPAAAPAMVAEATPKIENPSVEADPAAPPAGLHLVVAD